MDRTPTPRAQSVEAPGGSRQRLSKVAVDRVRAALASEGLADVPIREFPEGTATAVDAANALSVPVGEIVKSLIFMAGQRPILVLVSGPNRADVHKLRALIGEEITRANAAQVRQATGFAIGGDPPLGHPERLLTYCDPDLLEYDEVWAAAGTPNSVFAIDPNDLVRITAAEVTDVTEHA